ncbi:MAG: DNA internalization-related competence protein ComEC/Rec2 [Mariprofundales bacterium]
MLARLPLLWPAVGWVVGIALGLADGLPLIWTLIIALLAIGLWWRGRRTGWLLLAVGVGWGVMVLAHGVWQQQVDGSWLDRVLTVDARVVAVQYNPHRQRLTLDLVRRADSARLRGQMWLYLYGRKMVPQMLAGDRIHTVLRAHRPRNRANPGGFDFVSYCAGHGISLLASPVATAVGATHIQHQPDPTWMAQLRHRVREALAQLPAQPRAVLLALVLADRSQLTDRQWQQFSASGTAHLLAISGLHVGIVAGWGFFLVWWLLTRREAWIVRLPVRRCALVAGLLFALAYASLAGWTLPTQRAVLMLGAGVTAWWWRASAAPLNTMLAALMVMLLWDAGAVASLSLWLSFVAVMALLLYADRLTMAANGWSSKVVAMTMVTVIASLATLPLIAAAFGRLPLYTLPANLLLVPLYGLWILPCALGGALLAIVGWGIAAAGLFTVAAKGAQVGNGLLAFFYGLPGGSWWLPHLPWWGVMLLALLLIAAGWLLWRRHYRTGGVVVAVALLGLMAWPERDVDRAQLMVWDVGQGAATTLRLPGGFALALDAPGRAGSRFNGGSTVADGLRAQGVVHLDVVAISHLQSDHAGGIASLIRRVNRVGSLWLADVPENHASHWAQRLIAMVEASGGQVRWLARGDRVDVAGHAIAVLWPPRGTVMSNSNNLSLVLSVDLGHHHQLLMMGDSEHPVERQLLATVEAHDVMLMPHHGSRSSSSLPLLQRLQPQLAIAQSGYHNRYGFPAAQIVARYQALDATVINSANGAVAVWMDGARLQIRQWGSAKAEKRRTLAAMEVMKWE